MEVTLFFFLRKDNNKYVWLNITIIKNSKLIQKSNWQKISVPKVLQNFNCLFPHLYIRYIKQRKKNSWERIERKIFNSKETPRCNLIQKSWPQIVTEIKPSHLPIWLRQTHKLHQAHILWLSGVDARPSSLFNGWPYSLYNRRPTLRAFTVHQWIRVRVGHIKCSSLLTSLSSFSTLNWLNWYLIFQPYYNKSKKS